ncbi:cytidine deaminase [Mesoterricola sediminis]|uniref:Cytidine deaminase n=1 Tax=Mesoterricola sediminis TaxID=2927980 RepID=A0AA48HHE6_9BACT|nr:cytidine deaminase [Mesoterricola sediminis]BDU78273.1 cytidine deaminase [Mesoterricola sediminis]
MTFDDPQSPAWDALLDAAWKARANAHAPYSGFQVGAAILREDGSVTAGCNVENAAYPSSICAERNAVFAATAAGMKPGGLKAVVVVTDAPDLTPPCGSCRQVLAEFAEDAPVLLANRKARALHRLADLLPHAFTIRNLKG